MGIKRQCIVTAVVWVVFGGFLVVFNPARLPVIVLILPFVLLFAALYSLWVLAQRFATRYVSAGSGQGRRLGLGVCGTSVLLLVLQSLGQLTLRDVVTLGAIMAVGYLYLGRTSLRPQQR